MRPSPGTRDSGLIHWRGAGLAVIVSILLLITIEGCASVASNATSDSAPTPKRLIHKAIDKIFDARGLTLSGNQQQLFCRRVGPCHWHPYISMRFSATSSFVRDPAGSMRVTYRGEFPGNEYLVRIGKNGADRLGGSKKWICMSSSQLSPELVPFTNPLLLKPSDVLAPHVKWTYQNVGQRLYDGTSVWIVKTRGAKRFVVGDRGPDNVKHPVPIYTRDRSTAAFLIGEQNFRLLRAVYKNVVHIPGPFNQFGPKQGGQFRIDSVMTFRYGKAVRVNLPRSCR